MRVMQGSRIVMFKISFFSVTQKMGNAYLLILFFILLFVLFWKEVFKVFGIIITWKGRGVQIQKSKSQSFSWLCIVTQLVFHIIIAPPSLHICCLPFSLLISSRWMAQMKDLTSPQWNCCPEISLPYTMLFPSLCLKEKGFFSEHCLDFG